MAGRTGSRLLVLAAAALFSTGGAAIKSVSLPGWEIAGLRSTVAALVLLALPAARRGWSFSVVPVACAYAATMVLFVLANRATTAAAAIFLQSTAPLHVLLLAPLLLRERPRRRDLLLALGVAAGLAALLADRPEPLATAPRPVLGGLLGAGAGLAWAFTVVGLRWTGARGAGSLPAVVLGNALAALVALSVALPLERPSAADLGLVLHLGVLQIGLAYLCLVLGLAGVRAFEASLLLLAEPVLSPVWAWIVHGETLGLLTLAGGAFVIGAGALSTLLAAREEREPRRGPPSQSSPAT